MALYAILEPNLTAIREIRDFATLPNTKPGRVRPVVSDSVPAFNVATHKVINSGYVIEAAQVRQTWQVVALSATELDAAADTVEDNNMVTLYAAFVDDTITANQQKRTVKRLLKHYLKSKGLL